MVCLIKLFQCIVNIRILFLYEHHDHAGDYTCVLESSAILHNREQTLLQLVDV